MDNDNHVDMSLHEVTTLLNEAKELGASSVVITGGEPLLHSKILDIIELTQLLDFNCIITTNGFLLNHSIARHLVKYNNLSIQISLESNNPEIHDFIRNDKGAFEIALKACQLCATNNIPFSTSMTLMESNLNEINSFIELSEKLGAADIRFRRFIASGKGYENYSFLRPNKEGLSKAIKNIIRLNYSDRKPKTTIEQAPFGILLFKNKDALLNIPNICVGCSAGISLCVISSDGKLRPCASLPVVVADTKISSLTEIWQNNPILQKIRDRSNLVGKCGTCNMKMICGGCRADAYCLTGNMFSEDPFCWN
jgi:radical SAM protein with 4Fe4S-binding SPASM domain